MKTFRFLKYLVLICGVLRTLSLAVGGRRFSVSPERETQRGQVRKVKQTDEMVGELLVHDRWSRLSHTSFHYIPFRKIRGLRQGIPKALYSFNIPILIDCTLGLSASLNHLVDTRSSPTSS